ncbi:translocation/assembly module TamB domain-containing protein [Candidatus Paracaedibacter symbiosus]|uniref:translocation/assembly module TamB domain-containing protein n=1 Tax=Candidatus Paracaedibacter symbiosus TaxID=244582 RepID=UPI001E2C9613|nr:translocation/assembly module TamB [Candidatus Paracaedibacter symbiosus]
MILPFNFILVLDKRFKMIVAFKKFSIYALLTFISMLLIIQIPKVNTKITEMVLNTALPKGMKGHISRIHGQFPFDVKIDSVKISDQEGLWLDIHGFQFSWIGAGIFFGKIEIERIGAETLEIIRFPIIPHDKAAKKGTLPLPVEISEYFINNVKISPWYSGGVKIHGKAALARADQADFKLFIETIDQFEHGDADLLELEIHASGQKLIVFAEAKDSLTRLKTIAPELAAQIKEGDYEFNIDLEANLDGTGVTGSCTAAINNFLSVNTHLNQFIGDQLDLAIEINLDESGKNVIGLGDFSTSNNIKANWQLNYGLAERTYTTALTFNCAHTEHLFPHNSQLRGNVKATINAEGHLNSDHHVKWLLTGPTLAGRPLDKFAGNVVYEHQKGQIYANFRHPYLETILHGTFYLQDELLHFDGFEFKGIDHKINGNAVVDTTTFSLKQADFHVAIDNIKSMAKLFGQNLAGRVNGAIHHEDGQYGIDLKFDDAIYEDLAFHKLNTKIAFKNSENFTVNLNAGIGHYKRSNIESAVFSVETKQGKGFFEHHLKGGDMAWSTAGTLATVEQQWKVLLKELRVFYADQAIVELVKPVHLEATPETFKVAANTIKLGNGELVFTNLELGKIYKGKLTLTSVRPSILAFLVNDQVLDGKIKGELEIKGEKTPKVVAKLSIEDLSLKNTSRRTMKSLSMATTLVFRDSEWSLKLNYHDSENSKIEAAGTILTSTLIPEAAAKVSAKLKGHLDLSVLNGFIWWGDRFKGQLKIDLATSNTLQQLHHRGTLILHEGEYENAEFGTILRHIEVHSILNGSTLQITKLTGNDFRDGTFTGIGSVKLADLSAIQPQVFLKLENMLIANDDILSINVTGQINLKPTNKGACVLEGQIQTNFVDVFLEDTVQKIKNINLIEVTEQTQLRRKAPKNHPLIPMASTYDLKVHIPNKLLIEGHGIKSLWKGDLHVIGPLNNPEVKGELVIIRGRADVIGKQMSIAPDSKISFINQNNDVIPFLNIKVEKTIRDVDVMIWLRGIATDPKIDFISTPVLGQEEVVSLLLFGKPLNSVSSAQALQLATKLAAIKARDKGGNLINKFQDAFGLDEFSVGSNDSSDENGTEQQDISSGYSVRVGKQLNDHIYFGVDQGLGVEADTKAIVNIDVTKDTKVNLEAGSKGATVGYFWEKRY